MLEDGWKIFKSGSDIRGYGIACGSEPLYLSEYIVAQITYGFACWLSEKLTTDLDRLVVSVGHDSRISAPHLKKWVIETLTGAGVHVIDCGLSSTPAMFMTTVDLKCGGAVQITASHHPYDRNGFKYFTPSGGLEGENIEEILEIAQHNQPAASTSTGVVETVDYMDLYAAKLRAMICREVDDDTDYGKPLRGYKIVVDAGNGVGGFYASKVLAPLGADVGGSQFLEPDGTFPNHMPNPENKEAIDSVSAAVRNTDADLGVIFDTDVDRAGCVGKGGLEINRNRLVALAAAITLENNAGATIVTDSITSDGLTAFIEAQGGKHLRYMRGYKNVINKQIELNGNGVNCPLAIETSGHAAFKDNYYLDDGAYLVTKLIIKMAVLGRQNKRLNHLIDRLEEPLEDIEVRFQIKGNDFKHYGEQVIDAIKHAAESRNGWQPAEKNYEGIRVSTAHGEGDGWFLLRLSVHDPVMVLNAESNSAGGVKKMLAGLSGVFGQFELLDTAGLENAMNG